MPRNPQPKFESWGRYPKLEADLVPLHWTTDFPLRHSPTTKILPVGAGRSYGDVCLLEHGTLLKTRGMDRLLHFNPETGVLRCEAGATLAEILDFAVPRGFFLPVTPGTKYVTVGGAIANDIHGKNHHIAGTFGCHVPRFELVRSDGAHFECSPTENADWFSATVGGMGLTGLITWAEVRLRPIVSRKIQYKGTKFVGIDEFVALSKAAAHSEYTIAWIDCIATGNNFARGIFMQGDHSQQPEPLKRSKEPWLMLPLDVPEFALNRFSIGLFNTLYYNRQWSKEKNALVDYEPFFYPLDCLLHWNRMYGKSGLLQFQCVLPWEDGQQMGIIKILKTITASGLASFLAVIKVFGDAPSPGMLSFPMPGITLALDFPIRSDISFDLLHRLADIAQEHSGRMYPAKDARMTAGQFQSFYPQWQSFSRYIDPAFDSAFWQRVTAHG
ncbi:FAD-binding oxidoreductase [Alloacidobacterium sp.]|uniref:FAD-binding oxidoreductase n=1 Tax=Alloacidobacterium sp. TaxID=2951999 RepID=UPI002D28F7F5|nr:FAD-binding oxidoreductase [Alloacidobacterium sp.]HYK37161.1 FAD-binding oxidoreductase [Alloacidobacterium sp.]